MPRKLRIFVSSTMKDLANERDLVVRRLRDFNFEPVNAESWTPSGSAPWHVIETEIGSSDLFLLLLGERYGWIPTTGPMAGPGLSVTHLEFRVARDLGLPILPFLKRLEYGEDRGSDDPVARARFRDEVRSWEGGYVTTEFSLASDLVESVGRAVIGLLSDRFLREKISQRSEAASRSAVSLAMPSRGTPRGRRAEPEPLDLPPRLLEVVVRRDAFLFAGSGISLAAGLPSGVAFAEGMIRLLHEQDPTYDVNPVGSGLAGIATDVEATLGREILIDVTRDLLNPPQGLQPTVAHACAVRLFDYIVTSNLDGLFEEAARQNGLAPSVIVGEPQDPSFSPPTIVKLHGSADLPSSLVITESDVLLFDRTHPRLWQAVLNLLRSKPVIVVGSSLRDPSVARLFSEAGERVSGYFVAPGLAAPASARLRAWSLEYIDAESDRFFCRLDEIVGS